MEQIGLTEDGERVIFSPDFLSREGSLKRLNSCFFRKSPRVGTDADYSIASHQWFAFCKNGLKHS
jgi:hypothetical protein